MELFWSYWFFHLTGFSIYYYQVGFIPRLQDFFNIHKSVWYITITKWKIKTIQSSQYAEKAFDKIQHPLQIKKKNKNLSKVGVKWTYLNIIKAIYKKPTSNIILNEEKLKTFLLRSQARQWCPLSPMFINIVLEIGEAKK